MNPLDHFLSSLVLYRMNWTISDKLLILINLLHHHLKPVPFPHIFIKIDLCSEDFGKGDHQLFLFSCGLHRLKEGRPNHPFHLDEVGFERDLLPPGNISLRTFFNLIDFGGTRLKNKPYQFPFFVSNKTEMTAFQFLEIEKRLQGRNDPFNY